MQETLCGQLNLCWPDLTGKRVMGFGYALPYLSALRMRAQQCLAFMPAGQGALPWPCADKVATALVFEEDLPLPDASIDCILLIHALEYTENSFETLNEIWRVLVPNGQLIVIVPNRSGLWARNACTPFGYGEPYSRQQIVRLFEKHILFLDQYKKWYIICRLQVLYRAFFHFFMNRWHVIFYLILVAF